MGEIRKITCESCGRDWQLQTGCGLQHGMLKNIVPLFSENLQKGIYHSMSEMEFPIYDFVYQPAYCEYCCQLVSIPVFTPMGKPALVGGCPVCGRQTEPMQDAEQTACPVCGEKALRDEEIGIWD